MDESQRDVEATWRTLMITIVAIALLALGAIAFLVVRVRSGVRPPLTPSPMPTVTVTIASLQPLAELATVRYRTVAEVRHEQIPEDLRAALGVREEILVLAYADVKAGFDLQQLRETDLQVSGTRVRLNLPPPKILSVTLDPQRTHVVYYKRSWLVSNDPALIAKVLRAADEAVRREAVEGGILRQAAAYGQAYFENHLRWLGFTEVEVKSEE